MFPFSFGGGASTSNTVCIKQNDFFSTQIISTYQLITLNHTILLLVSLKLTGLEPLNLLCLAPLPSP